MKTPYFQVYDSKGLVYYTDENDRALSIVSIDKLHDFICANYPLCHITMYLDDNWNEVCLDYWNEVISKGESFKSENKPQSTISKLK